MELYHNVMGEGYPLIIIHGLFGMSDNWKSLGKKWSSDYEVHLLDMRNHGRSGHSDTFDYDAMSDDLAEYLESKSIDDAYILGHSMGGKVAMLFASLNPDKVRKLVVADIGPKYYEPHHEVIIEALETLDLENISSRSEARDNFADYLSDGVRQFLLKSLYWVDRGRLDWRFNLKIIAEKIENVGVALPPNAIFEKPTLFARGGESYYIKDEDVDLLYDHFPDAELETIPGAGHWLHAEKPEEFYELVNRFLAS